MRDILQNSFSATVSRQAPCTKTRQRLMTFGLLALGGLGLAGCQKKAPSKAVLQPVGVVTMRETSVVLNTMLPGRTDAYEQSAIRPQVSGVLTSITYRQGADVKQGEQLYQIYQPPYQAAYDRAKGQLLQAQANAVRAHGQLQRYSHLVGPHAVSNQDYDNTLATSREADAQVYQAKAELESAEVNLNYSHVRSPISGRIGRTIYTVGTLVTANQTSPIAVVTRLDPIYVDVNVAAAEMLRLRRELATGQLERNGSAAAVHIELPDGSTYGPVGKLELAEVTVDPATGTIIMRGLMPNPDKLLLPGMFVQAEIHEGLDKHALLVPQIGLLRTPKGTPYVLVLNDQNIVSIRPVTVSRTIGNTWLVTSGLKSGDRVVITGLQKIQPGAKVAPHAVNFDWPAAAGAPIPGTTQNTQPQNTPSQNGQPQKQPAGQGGK
ncbi:efflux RND transporter periplasmic adaptor subunit [Oecophyllibacter saccharovorans]|nr:efflux RND transporter periplasmic adaptor subunit [Oecophyllibacter saccharovorans]